MPSPRKLATSFLSSSLPGMEDQCLHWAEYPASPMKTSLSQPPFPREKTPQKPRRGESPPPFSGSAITKSTHKMGLRQKAPAALTSPSGQRRGQESGWSQDGEEESMPGVPRETPNHTQQSSVSRTLLTHVLTLCCLTGPLLSITRFKTFCTQVPTYHTASV